MTYLIANRVIRAMLIVVIVLIWIGGLAWVWGSHDTNNQQSIGSTRIRYQVDRKHYNSQTEEVSKTFQIVITTPSQKREWTKAIGEDVKVETIWYTQRRTTTTWGGLRWLVMVEEKKVAEEYETDDGTTLPMPSVDPIVLNKSTKLGDAFALTLLVTFIWSAVCTLLLWWLPVKRHLKDHCENCGYNLHGTAPGKPCPECGATNTRAA